MKIINALLIASTLLFCTSTSIANDGNANSGTVAETMTSGGYVYVLLEEDGTWLASTPIPVTVGDKVTYSSGMEMKDFTSRTLGRTFDFIRFVEKLEVVNQFDANAHAVAAASNQPGIEKSAAATAPVAAEFAPLDGGTNINNIRTEYQQLNGQEVVLRAKVMKVSQNILGKNWITLQDGTGTAPDNKLLATSTELAEIGDLVIAKGVVKTDVDLGSGYKYKVVMEEATFSN